MERTTWIAALLLAALMAAGAFTDAAAQTRERQGGTKDFANYDINCPKEKSKTVTVAPSVRSVSFRGGKKNCLCNTDSAGSAKNALKTGLEDMRRALIDPSKTPKFNKYLYENLHRNVFKPDGPETVVVHWFTFFGLYPNFDFQVSPPPGGKASQTIYCYSTRVVADLVRSLTFRIRNP